MGSSNATSRCTTSGESGMNLPMNSDHVHCEKETNSLAERETRIIRLLRAAVVVALVLSAITIGSTLFFFLRHQEQQLFSESFEDTANKILRTFHATLERNLGAVSSLSIALTSHALDTNSSFPFVTLPDFELKGSHVRVQSGSHALHWAPLVTDENRLEWEAYAMNHRQQIDFAYQNDIMYREEQDLEFGSPDEGRTLQETQTTTILDDGSGYHPRIWSNGAVTTRKDEPVGSGPYLPAWQRSPIDPGTQDMLNMNWQNTRTFQGDVLGTLVGEKKATLGKTIVPIPAMRKKMEQNLRRSQYRESVAEYLKDPIAFLAYPIFDSFDEDSPLVGVLMTNVYWKVLLSGLLQAKYRGIICVVKNGFNQTFAYRIDGGEATFLGLGDPHEKKYDYLGVSMGVNEYLETRSSPVYKAYKTAKLSDISQYRIMVYPSAEFENSYRSNKPMAYALMVFAVFAVSAAIFWGFAFVVEKRQGIMFDKVVEKSQRAALAERELNEFVCHEVRNPLSAAMSASAFISTALKAEQDEMDSKTRANAREDIDVVNSSLHFINDFLRSMLDIHRANDNKIKIEKVVIDLRQDVLEPVAAILHQRVAAFNIFVECPENLLVLTDPMRLKQTVLNLARNSVKFVEKGFIRIRACVQDGEVKVFVEDSGPGIPLEKSRDLFVKYQESLDLLNQGTGLGLSLSKKLMQIMGGDVYLDESYESGIDGCPGACFVLELNTSPALLSSTESELTNSDRSEIEGTAVCSVQSKPPSDVDIEAPMAPKSVPLPAELDVLCVDDDTVLRKLFVRALRKVQPGWTVSEASSGEAALNLCELKDYNLIFMDQYMASAEKSLLGTETSQIMRSKGNRAIICGLSANNMRDSFLRAGADDFCLKPLPCKPAELLEVLRRVFIRENVSGVR